MRDEVDDGGYDEHCDKQAASPVTRGEIAITHSAHGDHNKVVGLKEGDGFFIDTKEVVKYTYPVKV